jgi:hypothetical protein
MITNDDISDVFEGDADDDTGDSSVKEKPVYKVIQMGTELQTMQSAVSCVRTTANVAKGKRIWA